MKKLIPLALLLGLNLGYTQDFNPLPNFNGSFPFFQSMFGMTPQRNPSTEAAEICEDTEPLIPIQKTDLERNPKATHCKRSMAVVDTIVLHHAQTESTTSVEWINELHLNRGTTADPWYMIAYHYAIHLPYKGNTLPTPIVYQGRPNDLVGAHAGSDAFETLTPNQKKLLEENPMSCGKDGGEFKPGTDTILNGNKTKINNTSIGIVVIGNYSPKTRSNPTGYSARSPRHLTTEGIDMLARLVCQIQKNHPNVTRIRWHNFYKSTSCPGTIKAYVQKIRDKAGSYGCNFN